MEKINTKYEKEIIELIKTNPIYCINDIFAFFFKCSRATFYNHQLDKLDSIKDAIYEKRRKGVTVLKDKWINSDNPTLQLAAMRMICEPDEHRALNQNYTDHTTNGENINTTVTAIAKFESMLEDEDSN